MPVDHGGIVYDPEGSAMSVRAITRGGDRRAEPVSTPTERSSGSVRERLPGGPAVAAVAARLASHGGG